MVGKVRICIELDEEDYRDLIEMLRMYPEYQYIDELVKGMVMHNIKNYRRLREWVRRIIENEVRSNEE